MWTEMIPAAMTIMGSFMGAEGNYKAGQAAADAGVRAKAAADFQAAQLDQNSVQAIAAAQRTALEQARQTRYVASRALALAAAGGGGASDPTIVTLIARISAEGAYKQAVDLYQGEEKARVMRMGADAKRYEGEIARLGGEAKSEAYSYGATGSLLTGASSLFTRYGMGGNVGGSTSPIDSNGINWDNV